MNLSIRHRQLLLLCHRNGRALQLSGIPLEGNRKEYGVADSWHEICGGKSFFSTQQSCANRSTTTVVSIPESNEGSKITIHDSRLSKHPKNKNERQQTKAYLDLAKARLSGLVVATTAAGFVAAGGPIATQLDVLGSVVAGTALCSCSAAAWNQIAERHRDAKMKRTQQRPLVTGALTVEQAARAATLWGLGGTFLLATGTDAVTTALGAGNILLYAGLYTYMKPISIYNTWVGAVVGAIPPVMGWTAATGGSILDVEAMLLGTSLYLWQMPHFFALSYMHRMDYQRGGFAMVPCLEKDGQQTANLIVRYTWYLSTIPFVATVLDVTSSMFAFEGIVLNACALTAAHRFKRERTNANARQIFLLSLWYLPTLLILFLIHSKVWDEEKCRSDAITKFLADHIRYIRERGRALCVHEKAATGTIEGKDACPINIGTRRGSHGLEETSAALHGTAISVKSSLVSNNSKGQTKEAA